MAENQEYNPHQRTQDAAKNRLAEPKEKIEQQARDRDAVAGVLAEIEEATAYHAGKSEDNRRVAEPLGESLTEYAARLKALLDQGWDYFHNLNPDEEPNYTTLNPRQEYELMELRTPEYTMVLRRKKNFSGNVEGAVELASLVKDGWLIDRSMNAGQSLDSAAENLDPAYTWKIVRYEDHFVLLKHKKPAESSLP